MKPRAHTNFNPFSLQCDLRTSIERSPVRFDSRWVVVCRFVAGGGALSVSRGGVACRRTNSRVPERLGSRSRRLAGSHSGGGGMGATSGLVPFTALHTGPTETPVAPVAVPPSALRACWCRCRS
jgi:hypothetical protein